MATYGTTPKFPAEEHQGQHPPPVQGRRTMPAPLVLLCISFGIFSVASLAVKFLDPRGAAGRRPDDTNIRLVAAEATEVSTLAAASTAASAGEQGRASVLDNTGDGCTAATTYALHGVDLVSFFSLAAGDEPVIGSTRYSSSYGGYEYVFSSALNKALFEAEPLLYLPAWGGFCGYGIARESTWSATTLGPPIDVAQWSIIPDGRLRFYRSQEAKKIFLDDMEANVASGDARWISWFRYDSATYPVDVSCFYHEAAGDG